MAKVYSNYNTPNDVKLYYEIIQKDGVDNGFDIYAGENATVPLLHQPEPFIPNPDISYAENAIKMCEELGISASAPSPKPKYINLTEDEYLEIQANIDYLLLISE